MNATKPVFEKIVLECRMVFWTGFVLHLALLSNTRARYASVMYGALRKPTFEWRQHNKLDVRNRTIRTANLPLKLS